MAFIGSIDVVYLDGKIERIRPTLADELEWQKQTKRTIQQYSDLSIYDLSILVHEYLKRDGKTDKTLLEWSKDIDALIPVGDHPKVTTPEA
jgi:hypothetical protein